MLAYISSIADEFSEPISLLQPLERKKAKYIYIYGDQATDSVYVAT